MQKNNQPTHHNKVGWARFLRSVKRTERKRKINAGLLRHQLTMKFHAEASGHIYRKYKSGSKRSGVVELPVNIRFLSRLPEVFSDKSVLRKDSGHFVIPTCFSLIDNYSDSFDFLKRLFFALFNGNTPRIVLDYGQCERIDVDASICMDLMLAEMIDFIHKSRRMGNPDVLPKVIQPINYQSENIKKILFSIGAYRNLRGFEIKFPDIEALPVLINYKYDPEIWEKSELHLTQIVEYIKRCLKRLERELTTEAETGFYKVIGEVMSNAEEHGTMPHRFAIGFFQETHDQDEHFGVFNFSIFNFGDTIYQTFKSPNCKNPKAVKEMTNLSEEYTKKGWFKKADFEEETLWTLYALQQGVTSKEKKRGNGSIEYIENFFRLKGDMKKEELSKLVVHSGHSRIVFDGSYGIVKKQREGEKRIYKMITFNKTGDIGDKPSSKFVTFVPHFFPGTLISARILIKFNNTNAQLNGNQDI